MSSSKLWIGFFPPSSNVIEALDLVQSFYSNVCLPFVFV